MVDLEKLTPRINQVCRNLPVKKLGLFGSAVTDNFSQNSDVDVLVVFDRDQKVNLFNAYFDLKEQLEEVFGRDVDLVVDKLFKTATNILNNSDCLCRLKRLRLSCFIPG